MVLNVHRNRMAYKGRKNADTCKGKERSPTPLKKKKKKGGGGGEWEGVASKQTEYATQRKPLIFIPGNILSVSRKTSLKWFSPQQQRWYM